MTKRLYEGSDALTFTAKVISCQPIADGWETILDQTAFYPEGGGQPWDTGILGGCRVIAVHDRKGSICHLLDGPLEPGETVAGEVDAARRLDHCQQHTGEHILSGTLYQLYNAKNVGFHIGDPWVRMDIDLPLTDEQLARAEAQANAVIWKNVPVKTWYPTGEELVGLTYRSKKELEGPVRLVEVPGADLCACCGTHLAYSGGVGMIKIVSSQSYKGGVRLAVAAGERAYRLLAAEHTQIEAMSALLSARPDLVEQAARRMAEENRALKAARASLSEKYIRASSENVRTGQTEIRFCDGMEPDGLRRFCMAIVKAGSAFCALFAPGARGLSYVVAWPGKDARQVSQNMNRQFNGKGGGSAALCQGSLAEGEYREVKKWLEEQLCHENEI